MIYHSLERTNPKGQPFVGYCIRCGKRDLPGSAIWEECPNTNHLSDEDALVAAVKGPRK